MDVEMDVESPELGEESLCSEVEVWGLVEKAQGLVEEAPGSAE